MDRILVLGSINMDLLVRLDEIPRPGETVLGKSLERIAGGKGANQAVAIGKLGGDVSFLGKVGQDLFGDLLLEAMEESGVDIDLVERGRKESGIALINVDKKGNNNIVVIPGANWELDGEYIERNKEAFKDSKLVLLQLEIPLESVKEALKLAKSLGKTTILNPAPARSLDQETIENIDILIPNQHELARLVGLEVESKNSILKAARILLDKGIKEIIVTLGSRGVLYINKDRHKFYRSYKVKALDTTAAGDSFIGGFVSSFIENGDMEKSIDRGQRAASLTVQKFGAQSSLPTKTEVDGGNYE